MGTRYVLTRSFQKPGLQHGSAVSITGGRKESFHKWQGAGISEDSFAAEVGKLCNYTLSSFGTFQNKNLGL